MMTATALVAQEPPPGAIKLLPQYAHVPATGKNAGKSGVIQRPNGPRIEYEFGISAPHSPLPPEYAPSPHGAEADITQPHMASTKDIDLAPLAGAWIEESTSIAGRPVKFFGTSGKGGSRAEIYFTRDKLRFRSPYANLQQLAEVLLTALSYPARPGQPGFLRIPFRRIKLEKDPPNTLITHGQANHTVSTRDSGKISQPNEPVIEYVVGPPPAPLAQWTLRQDFIGQPITVTFGDGQSRTLQVVFQPQPGSDADPVTFRSVVRNDKEFVHALMTILTYHQQ